MSRSSPPRKHPRTRMITPDIIQIASIVNSFMRPLGYGIYITTFILCLRWLVCKDEGWSQPERRNMPMLVVSIVIFLLETVGLATGFGATLAAQNVDRMGYDILTTINVTLGCVIFQVVDAALVYRCWVVYANTWTIVCLPVFLWLSNAALGSYNIYVFVLQMSARTQEEEIKLATRMLKIWNAFFACNIAVNIYATAAIVYLISTVAKKSVRSSRGSRLHQTWRIVAESGALYTLSTILNLIAIVLCSRGPGYAVNILGAITDPISVCTAGIAFNLILIRVDQQRRQRMVDQDKTSDSQFGNNSKCQISMMRFKATEDA
ncbi:hypothetical protein AX15_007899 [Amanita polypyramis BW_CC]|nr:hypothetical protein AX15_007899 [Amanita polypyramis BW_CC]